jgi:hypothetical protein
VPAAKDVPDHTAWLALFNATVAKVVALSEKVTEPVVTVPFPVLTVAVRVTGDPTLTVDFDRAREVVVAVSVGVLVEPPPPQPGMEQARTRKRLSQRSRE